MQPVGNVNVILATPKDNPVTIPVEDPTNAVLVELLLHVPPGSMSLKVVV